MGRKIEGNNTVVLTVFLKLGGEVALIAIQDDYTIRTLPPAIYKLVEVLNPI